MAVPRRAIPKRAPRTHPVPPSRRLQFAFRAEFDVLAIAGINKIFFPLLICEDKNGESAERNSRTLVISGWLKLSTSKRRFSKTHAAQAHVLYRG